MAELLPKIAKVGDFVDCKESTNRWSVGIIIEQSASAYKIRFDGLGEKMNVSLPMTSERLAPFRKHSRLYTGQSKLTIRDWVYSEQEIKHHEHTLDSLISLGTGDPYYTTQFLRGSLFTLVDNLLTCNYHSSTDRLRAVQFFMKVIDYIIAWLNDSKRLFEGYKRGLSVADLYLADDLVAVGMSWPELLHTLARLFGQDYRTSKFFDVSEVLPFDSGPESVTMKKETANILSFHINYFASKGGFSRILDTLSFAVYEFILELPVYLLGRYLLRDFMNKWTSEFKRLLMERVHGIGNGDIKDIDKDCVIKVLQAGHELFKELEDDDFQATIERTELEILLKFLNSPYLEKKLKSLNEFKEIIEQCSLVKYNGKWLNSDNLVQWLLQNQVPELILDCSHAELIKRSPDLLAFLAKHRALSDQILLKIWNSTRNRHESLITEVYQLIIDIISYLPRQSHQFLVSQFSEMTAADYDEKFATFLKQFVCKLSSAPSDNPITDYGLRTFFDLMQDESEAQLQRQATKYLEEILKKPSGKCKLWEYLDLCVENVKANRSLPQSLKLLRGIIDILSNQHKTLHHKEPRLARMDGELVHLIDLVLVNTQNYMREGASGKFSHAEQLTERLGFLEDMHKTHSLLVSVDQFGLLWGLFVLRPVTPADSAVFFKWLSALFRDLNSFQFKQDVFVKFFCNSTCLDPTSISEDAYECFCSFFTVINAEEKLVQTKHGMFYLRLAEQLKGFIALFNIYLNTTNEHVQAESALFIVALTLKLTSSLSAHRVWTQFIQQCLLKIENQRTNPLVVSRALLLLLRFLENNPAKKEKNTGTALLWSFKTNSEYSLNKCVLYADQTTGSLRRKIADHYKVSLETVVMTIGYTRCDKNDDHVPLSLYRDNIAMVDFSGKPSEDSPREALAAYPHLQESLFQVLSDHHPETSEIAWRILTSLPLCKEVYEQFRTLTVPVETLLEASSAYRLTYSLIIVQNLAQHRTWVLQFCNANGLQHLLNIFLNSRCEVRALVPVFYSRLIAVIDQICESANRSLPVPGVQQLLRALITVAEVCQENDEEEAPSVCTHATNLLCNTMQQAPGHLSAALADFDGMGELLHSTLFLCPNKFFASLVVQLFLKLSLALSDFGGFLLGQMLEVLESAITHTSKGEYYWTLLEHLIKETAPTEKLLDSLTVLTVQLLQRQPEASSKDNDCCLAGIMNVLSVAIPKTQYQPAENLPMFVLQRGLFTGNPLFKSLESRRAGFELLKTLCKANRKVDNVLEYLRTFHQELYWRTSRNDDWNFAPVSSEKSDTGFVGLKNQGCTCYMNSSMQQLFHINSFKEGILLADDHSDLPVDDNLLIQLQKMFAGLKSSDREFIDTKDFCAAVKDYSGRPVNVMEQMDVDEFFNSVMDKVEKQLQGDTQEHIVKNHFGGVQVTQCIGQGDCKHVSERNEPFLSLSLQVKNKNNLFESLETYVQGDLLEKENAYQCDSCSTKVTALRRVCIKHLPNILVIGLKRFEFDFDSMKRLKVNDYYEFPQEINMLPYTQEGLEHSENLPPDDYYNYELRGIVIHVGTAEFGHYYSLIKDRTYNQWFCFNDTLVTAFDPINIPEEAFGGGEKPAFSTAQSFTVKERTKNAYMLFYERKTSYMPRSDVESLEVLSIDSLSGVPKEFSDIKEANERDWLRRSLFSTDYFDFVQFLSEYQGEEQLKFMVEFVFAIMIRSKLSTKIPYFVHWIMERLKKYSWVSDWVLELATCPEVLQELLLDCPILEKRKLILNILHSALWATKRENLERTLKRVLNKLEMAKKPNTFNYSQYFELIYRIIELSPSLVQRTALSHKLLGHALGCQQLYTIYAIPNEYPDTSLGYAGTEFSRSLAKDRFTLKESDATFSYLFACMQIGVNQFDGFDVTKLLLDETMLIFSMGYLNRLGCRAMAELYCQICHNSKERSFKYANFLIDCISREDHDRHKPYFRQLVCFLKYPDSIQPDRADYTLKLFNEQMKFNAKYFRATESCIYFLINVANRLTSVKEWVLRKKHDLKWIDHWLRDVHFATSLTNTALPKNITLHKFRNNESLPYNIPDITFYLTEQFRKVLSKGMNSSHCDSDSEQPSPTTGMRVEVTDPYTRNRARGVVVDSFEGVFLMKCEGNDQVKWVDSQTEGQITCL